MKAKTSSQLAEIGKKSEAIGRLKFELSEDRVAVRRRGQGKAARRRAGAVRTDTEIKSTALEDAERALAATQAELAQATANFNEASVTADSQRVELVMLRAQAEALKEDRKLREGDQGAAQPPLPADCRDRQPRPAAVRGAQQGRNARQPRRRARPPAHCQTTEAEILGRRVQELVARLDEQGRFLADREYVSDRLRTEAASAQKTEADVRSGLSEAERRHRLATEAIRTEKTLLEEQLKQSQDERAKLQREMATMKRDAETAWASSAWKVPCCASASATSPPRWRG